MILIFGGVILMMSLFHTTRAEDLTAYAGEILEIDLSELVEKEEGKVEKSFFEEYAYIRFTVTKEGQEAFARKMEESGKKARTEISKIPGYNGDDLAKDLSSQTVTACYDVFLKGRKSKTRSLECYLAEDVNGYYIYLFG